MTIVTRAQAEALHSAIEARDDAWNRFHNAALMPANQTPDERLVQTANNWIAAERAVQELSHGGDLVIPEPGVQAVGGTTATAKAPAKRRGRPPKAKTADGGEGTVAKPGEAANSGQAEPGSGLRSIEDVKGGDGAAA
jgi:hypothetical protein